jgi:hypothetical protein
MIIDMTVGVGGIEMGSWVADIFLPEQAEQAMTPATLRDGRPAVFCLQKTAGTAGFYW